ncbi:LysR substrate-binding domain-containing protein, partial [Pseudomonas sp. R62]
HEMLPTVISDFLGKYPQVQLEVVLLNRRVDLVTEGIDVALRVRDHGDEDPLLVTRRLRQAQAVVIASPAFMQGKTINHPQDLKNLPVLGALEADRMVHVRLLDQQGKSVDLSMEARLGIDDFVVRKACVLAGQGFTVLPMMFCETELRNGTLVQVLPEWSLPGGWLQAVYPHRRGVMPAVRAWIDHLVESFNACGDRFL